MVHRPRVNLAGRVTNRRCPPNSRSGQRGNHMGASKNRWTSSAANQPVAAAPDVDWVGVAAREGASMIGSQRSRRAARVKAAGWRTSDQSCLCSTRHRPGRPFLQGRADATRTAVPAGRGGLARASGNQTGRSSARRLPQRSRSRLARAKPWPSLPAPAAVNSYASSGCSRDPRRSKSSPHGLCAS